MSTFSLLLLSFVFMLWARWRWQWRKRCRTSARPHSSERASRHVETCHALATYSSSCLLSPFLLLFFLFIHSSPFFLTCLSILFPSFILLELRLYALPHSLFICVSFFSRVSVCICCWGWKEGVHTRFLPCAILAHIPTAPFFFFLLGLGHSFFSFLLCWHFRASSFFFSLLPARDRLLHFHFESRLDGDWKPPNNNSYFFFFFVKRYLYLRTHTFLSDGGSGTEEQGGVTEKRARLWRWLWLSLMADGCTNLSLSLLISLSVNPWSFCYEQPVYVPYSHGKNTPRFRLSSRSKALPCLQQ